MSKARRPRYQRHGGKPTPNGGPAAPAVEAIPDAPSPPEPVAAQALDAPAAFTADIAEIGSSPAGDMPELLPELSPELPPIASPEVPPQDAAVPALAAPSPSLVPAPALSPVPARVSVEAFGTTVMNYFIGEGEAMGAHWRALSGARSMAEIIRLQIGEFQRAADATLTCWGMLTLAAGRTVAPR